MKKIGILTFAYGSNFGGTLQCIGLYKVLKNTLKKEVEILNYVPKGIYNHKRLYLSGAKTRNKIDFKKIIIKLKYVKKSINKFEKFRKQELKMTEYLSEKKIILKSKEYTDLIVGSDQVWNVTGEMRGAYFFEGIENVNKISYAACSGSNFYKREYKERLKNAINTFNYISVRNKHTYDFIKRLTKKEAEIVCDPSILYDYKEYLIQEKPEEKYILTYILGTEINGGHEEIIKKIKEKVGAIKVIAVGIAYVESGSLQFYPWADKVLYDASPEEWLNLINNAEFIYTDSYHGVLFSMKFHKNFLAYYSEKNRASRFIDLANRYEIEDWIINSIDDLKNKNSLKKEIDYMRVDKLLTKHKEQSISFLKKALSGVHE